MYKLYRFLFISYFITATIICTFQMDLIDFYSVGEYRSMAGLRIGRPYNIERMYCYVSYSGLCCLMLLRQTSAVKSLAKDEHLYWCKHCERGLFFPLICTHH
jgi:hypothetical protein